MSIPIPKKIISILAIACYVSLTNFCVVSAVVTAEDRAYDNHAEHHDHGGNHHHDHDSPKGSDQCCTKISRDFPALLPKIDISASPNFWMISLLAIPTSSSIHSNLASSEFNNHDPPGLLTHHHLLSRLLSRAPPFLPSR